MFEYIFIIYGFITFFLTRMSFNRFFIIFIFDIFNINKVYFFIIPKMGIASLVGRIAKVFKGGGRLAKNIIDRGRQIIGKVSPFVKKGFEFAQRIPGFINNAKRKKEQVSDDIKGVVDMLPNSKIKDKIQNIVNRGDQAVDRVIDKGREMSDKAMPWVNSGYDIARRVKLPYFQGPTS